MLINKMLILFKHLMLSLLPCAYFCSRMNKQDAGNITKAIIDGGIKICKYIVIFLLYKMTDLLFLLISFSLIIFLDNMRENNTAMYAVGFLGICPIAYAIYRVSENNSKANTSNSSGEKKNDQIRTIFVLK